MTWDVWVCGLVGTFDQNNVRRGQFSHMWWSSLRTFGNTQPRVQEPSVGELGPGSRGHWQSGIWNSRFFFHFTKWPLDGSTVPYNVDSKFQFHFWPFFLTSKMTKIHLPPIKMSQFALLLPFVHLSPCIVGDGHWWALYVPNSLAMLF